MCAAAAAACPAAGRLDSPGRPLQACRRNAGRAGREGAQAVEATAETARSTSPDSLDIKLLKACITE